MDEQTFKPEMRLCIDQYFLDNIIPDLGTVFFNGCHILGFYCFPSNYDLNYEICIFDKGNLKLFLRSLKINNPRISSSTI